MNSFLCSSKGFNWDYVNDSLEVDVIVNISYPVFFTSDNKELVFIYISQIQSGAVGYGAFYVFQFEEGLLNIIEEFPDFIV